MSTKLIVLPLLLAQGVFLVLFFVFGVYSSTSDDSAKYPLFQDVHVMIFIGFGFLMTFLKRYGFSSVGFTLLLGSFIIQWSLICQGFFELNSDYQIGIGIESIYKADIAAASVLISLGAILGRTSVLDLIIMGFIEIIMFSTNSYVGTKLLKVTDAGGSIFVHVFGAYFGLAVSFMLKRRKEGVSDTSSTLQESNYTSDIFAMIGTVFLWLYWPSFNAIELTGDQQHRAIINTYLALASCSVTAFATSSLLTPHRKFDMVHVQNSTLAGGVAVGAAANLMIFPGGAITVGTIAGFVSVFGYNKLSPLIEKLTGIQDTCGVHNLHGIPGVLSGLLSILMAGITTDPEYDIYPARSPVSNLTDTVPRSAAQQAGYQALGLSVTLVIAIVSGLITGFILTVMKSSLEQTPYNDAAYWHMPEDSPADVEKNKTVTHYDNASFETSVTDGTQKPTVM